MYRRETASFMGMGCLVQSIIYILMVILSKFIIGYALGVWFGAEIVARWEQVNVLVQWLIALVTASVAIPVGVVSFFAQLIADTPIF